MRMSRARKNAGRLNGRRGLLIHLASLISSHGATHRVDSLADLRRGAIDLLKRIKFSQRNPQRPFLQLFGEIDGARHVLRTLRAGRAC